MPSSIPLEKDKAVLLVIDMQNDFVRENAPMEVPSARQRIPAMAALVAQARKARVPVIYTRHVLYDEFDVSPLETKQIPRLRTAGMRAGTPGVDIIDELAPLPGEIVISKHRYDAFYNTRLDTVIRTIRGPHVADSVIITGTVTSVCCESTARSAFMRDLRVFFVDDATGGFDDASHQATLATIDRVFGKVVSTRQVLDVLGGA
ncbi:MAG: isochorismatase family cysteine hydrolase [Pigmentiphaga sp.]|uniref:isochorismatase family cysteine hydrolase n=1 Tax=Pigmentiphaga sp. TaxID=1977564 RepID=UPI0029A0A7AB|nr:isochorismatase family cysteine hydrolase [Pigmentiphaga sp.]MDX3905327.1 isochorismatase family cysteine hydrolase [Pigmentiphaga sp.]